MERGALVEWRYDVPTSRASFVSHWSSTWILHLKSQAGSSKSKWFSVNLARWQYELNFMSWTSLGKKGSWELLGLSYLSTILAYPITDTD